MMDVSCIVSDADADDDDEDPGSAESLISTGRCHVQINVERGLTEEPVEMIWHPDIH